MRREDDERCACRCGFAGRSGDVTTKPWDAMFQIWRLSEAGPDNLGLAFTDGAMLLGRTPLIERRQGRFVVREQAEIDRLMKRAHIRPGALAGDHLMRGLATVAAALNANDPCLASIAAVHLKIPDLPDAAARDALEVEDALIKSAKLKASKTSSYQKASPDDPKHPGWPKGTPDGKGGKFRPKTDAEIAPEVKARALRLAARRGLLIAALKLLRLSGESAANLIPILDVAADAALVLDVADTVAQFLKLKRDVRAAFDFAEKGPRDLKDLQVPSADYEEFSSYGDFTKGESAQEAVTKRFGAAGDGYQYHHIVTQGGANDGNIPAEQLQNTNNIIRLPTLLHEAVNAAYLKPAPDDSDMNMYQWLQTQPYDVQRERGLMILRDLNILK